MLEPVDVVVEAVPTAGFDVRVRFDGGAVCGATSLGFTEREKDTRIAVIHGCRTIGVALSAAVTASSH